jgi:sporulation protein YlmC with PRC-barrel domain
MPVVSYQTDGTKSSTGRSLTNLRGYAPQIKKGKTMKRITSVVSTLCVLAAVPAYAASDMMVPKDSVTVTDWYKQTVYNSQNSSIGKVDDVLVSKSGKVTTLIVGVGGFLGAGEKDVAVPFEAVKMMQKDNSWRLVMDATKDELKAAQGYKYDKDSTTWVPAK